MTFWWPSIHAPLIWHKAQLLQNLRAAIRGLMAGEPQVECRRGRSGSAGIRDVLLETGSDEECLRNEVISAGR